MYIEIPKHLPIWNGQVLNTSYTYNFNYIMEKILIVIIGEFLDGL
jgi:hypothetical protein